LAVITLFVVSNTISARKNKKHTCKVIGINDKNKYLTLKYYCYGIIFVNIAAVIYPGTLVLGL